MSLHSVSAFGGSVNQSRYSRDPLTDGNIRPLSREVLSQQLIPLRIALIALLDRTRLRLCCAKGFAVLL